MPFTLSIVRLLAGRPILLAAAAAERYGRASEDRDSVFAWPSFTHSILALRPDRQSRNAPDVLSHMISEFMCLIYGDTWNEIETDQTSTG